MEAVFRFRQPLLTRQMFHPSSVFSPRGCEGTLTSLELNFRVFWKLSTLAVAGRMLSLSFEPTATILQPDTVGKEHMKPKGDQKLRES